MDNGKITENIRVWVAKLTILHVSFVAYDNIDHREVGIRGVVCGPVVDHSGFWWVRHDNNEVSVYYFDELEEETPRIVKTIHAPIRASHNL